MEIRSETRVVYGSPEAEIRATTLRRWTDGWETPTPDEVRWVMKMAGLTGRTASELVGIANNRTIRRWTGGDCAIPYAAWALLCEKAGLGMIWK